MRVTCLLAALLFALLLPTLPAAPAHCEGELQTTLSDGGEGGQRVELGALTVRYHISTRMGEPIQRFDVLLRNANPVAEITGIRLRAEAFTGGKSASLYLEFPVEALGREDERQTSTDWLSPGWDRWFRDERGEYADMDTVKALLAGGLNLRNLQVVRLTVRRIAAAADKDTHPKGEWQRLFSGDYGSESPLSDFLPVGEQPGFDAVTKANAARGWVVLGYWDDLKGEIGTKPAGLAISVPPPELSIWRTSEELMLKGRFGLAKGTVVSWELPDENARRVLDGGVDAELFLQLNWNGKTAACRRETRLVPGRQVEMAIRLPLPRTETIAQADLLRAAKGAVMVSVPFAQRPPRKNLEDGADLLVVDGGGRRRPQDDPFLANRHAKGNAFQKRPGGKASSQSAGKSPFQRKKDGNAFERAREVEWRKQFLSALNAASVCVDRQDWAGADLEIRRALAVPGYAEDERLTVFFRRMGMQRYGGSARFIPLLERLAEIKKEIETFVRRRVGEDAVDQQVRQDRVKQAFDQAYVTTRQKEFVLKQRQAKAVMDANPAVVEGLTEDRKALLPLVNEPVCSTKTCR